MRRHTELRVHGVSGTPPRDMLHTDPVTSDPETDHTRVYRRRPLDVTEDPTGETHLFDAVAFHWGSLTTGHWLTAFWILLGPFAFANVAGWMASRRGRWQIATIRLAGLAMTALFVAQLGYVLLEIGPALAPPTWRRPVVLVTALAYPASFVGGIVMWLSTQSHFHGFGWGQRTRLTLWPKRRYLLPPLYWDRADLADTRGQWDDPAGSRMTSPDLWAEHAIAHRIRRLHLAAGVGVVTAYVAVGIEVSWLRWLAIGIAAWVIAFTILTTSHPRSSLVQGATAWAPLLSLIGFALAYWHLATSATPPSPWPGLHVTTFVVALTLGAAGLSAILAGLVSLGAIVIGTLYGASLGVGLGLIGERYAGVNQLTANGAGWVAVAMLFLLLALSLTALCLSFSGGPLPPDGKVMALLRRVTARGALLLRVAAIYGLVAGAVAFAAGCSGRCSPDALRPPQTGSPVYLVAIVALALTIALIAARSWALSRVVAATVALVGAVAIWLFAIGRLPSGNIAGYAVDFNDLVDLSKGLIIVLPAVFVLRSLLGSIRRGTSNRQVGILWDVASLWPRWFQPLAPPAYGPQVVESLISDVSTRRPDIIEAHSQGSVIAVLAISRLEDVAGISLLTYGSPLGLLYSPMFPDVGVRDLVEEVDLKLDGRWRNLWRATDPLGGAPVGLDGDDIEAQDGTGHSGYELTTAFRETRHHLIGSDKPRSEPVEGGVDGV